MPIALITGAAKRIGKIISLNLAQNGWDLLLHYNSSKVEVEELKKTVEKSGIKAEVLHCDFRNLGSIEHLIKQDSLDLLINNASSFENDNIGNFFYEDITNKLKINLIAPMLLTKVFVKKSANVPNSNIINILDCGIKNIPSNFISYYITKNALAHFTKIAARNLAPTIRVNGIALGQTIKNPKQSEGNFNKAIQQSLLKKNVSEKNLIDTIYYLIQNRNLTGNIIFLEN
ncbi:MAG: SDR family NAD(P)-dependent oxidoreductase [Candidatus Midichloria sp.]|nr:MAG: SDR family NAD(P)-dependent oxidoreductase [Candidatus Midichloria sp.]